jgi:DNA-directed RNA polymerase specialized sigma24 family protein
MSEWSALDNPATRTAFDATLLREQQALRDFVRGLTGDAEQARDITQDIFMVAWRAAIHCKRRRGFHSSLALLCRLPPRHLGPAPRACPLG